MCENISRVEPSVTACPKLPQRQNRYLQHVIVVTTAFKNSLNPNERSVYLGVSCTLGCSLGFILVIWAKIDSLMHQMEPDGTLKYGGVMSCLLCVRVHFFLSGGAGEPGSYHLRFPAVARGDIRRKASWEKSEISAVFLLF